MIVAVHLIQYCFGYAAASKYQKLVGRINDYYFRELPVCVS